MVAAAIPLGVLVSWLPGEELADAYRVYGAVDGTLVLLNETVGPHEWSAVVGSGYPVYAVSGVKGGEETDPVPTDPTFECVKIDPPRVIFCKQPDLVVLPPGLLA